MATRGVSVIACGGQDYTINDPNIAAEFSSSTSYAVNDYVYHNGNLYQFTAEHSGAWDSGDVTQVLATDAVTDVKNGMVYSEKTNNLIAPKGLILGRALNPNTGGQTTNENYDLTGYIPVAPDMIVYGIGGRYCLYDSGKTFISGATGLLSDEPVLAGTVYNYLTIPAGAAYLRVSIPKTAEKVLYTASGFEMHALSQAALDGGNLWNFGTVKHGKALDSRTGAETTNADYNTTDYLPVAEGELLYMNGGGRFWFYDSTKAATTTGNVNSLPPMSGGSSVKGITVPAGAAYFRVCADFTVWSMSTIYVRKASPYELLLGNANVYTSGMKYYALGDSITKGMYANEGASSSTGKTDASFPYWIAAQNGFDLTNLGVSGSGYVKKGTPEAGVLDDDSPEANAVDIVDGNSFTGADVITLAWGINDYKGPATIYLGSVETAEAGDGTVIGNMMYCIEKLIEKAPKANIIVMLPMNQNRFGSSTEAMNWSFGYPFNPSADNKTLSDYRDAIKACAEHYNLMVIDPETVSPINRLNIRSCLGDGLHPTIPFHKRLGLACAPYVK